MKRLLAVTLASAALVVAPAVHADAAAKPKVYKNCTKAHADYPHGFRKKGAVDQVTGDAKPVPTSKIPVRTALYKANKKLDRDKDGVACEA